MNSSLSCFVSTQLGSDMQEAKKGNSTVNPSLFIECDPKMCISRAALASRFCKPYVLERISSNTWSRKNVNLAHFTALGT